MDAMGGGGPAARLLLGAAFAALALFYLARATEGCVHVHAPHLLMATGMVYMVLPDGWQVLPLGVWLAVYGSASCWCVRRLLQWRRSQGHLDLEFLHSELAGCVAMAAMLPLFTIRALDGVALPLTIALGTYFLAYTAFWGWRLSGAPGTAWGTPAGVLRADAVARSVMGAGMAFMLLVM